MLILDFVICVLLYKICMLLSSKNVNLSLLIMMITDILISFVLGLANPYGYEMHTLIFKCYGDSRFSGLVNELRHFSPFDSLLEAFVFLSMICVLFLYIFGNKKRIRIRYLLMFFGFLALSMNTVKGLSHFILVMFFPMALLCKNIRLEKVIDAKIGRDILKVWSGVVSVCVFLCG